ncbi:uncharacterized protein N7515_006339 [Penicillium bovifimosum]|uniref:Telomere-associated protein Rif1 N-terminal domain-containing protein n=1 Tax=Penicillium bovifimosum TaxID=126998 RepID=A0A9W9GUG0_9EURO|nr:uncharacterized protein N7515_006339 [Penicillium bovifimosum]KAJ5130300.1 hypothetical protein N7515_006339 [Penicillium bovifimosum]
MVEMISARPPTPPRTASRIVIDNTESPLPVQTPKESPFSTLGSVGAGPSSRSSKKVNFSPWPKFIKPPSFTSALTSAPDTNNTPSSTESKPTKSILKATQSPIPVWSPNVDTFTAESLAMLLESVIQQLAGESISSRLDAYMQFFGALRTYDGLPAGQEIADKLNLITEFIQRDVSRDLADGLPLDTNLANQALKLSAAFVWHAQISTQLSEEFKVFLIDHSISCLYEAKVPKSVLTHYMSILSTQNFGPKVMTTARVTRLLAVLQDITKKISGNAIVSYRLNIYQRLMGQAKSTFISQASLWVEHLIFGLLHHLKDTRSKAIAFGFQVTMEAGPNPILSKNIRDLFDRPLDHDRKLVTEVRERMTRMMPSVESGVHIPQIWSIIVLFLRSKRWSLEQWDHFREWVLVLQKCFNCSEPAIKAQAILGWNRFVFAVSPNESTSRSLLKMLGKPVLSQFDRKKTDKLGLPPSPLALASYCNLLYYTFRPSASFRHLDIIWEEYVATPSAGIFSSAPVLSDSLARILTNLLWSAQPKLWTENRINESTKIEAEELPAADSRWVRSRITPILRVFEHVFKASVWDDDAVGQSHVALAWTSLSNALSLASSKEITPSGESMQAAASVWGLLRRVWATGPSSLNAETIDLFFGRFQFLSTTMIVSIGGIPFTEKLLLRNAEEAANTPANPHPNTSPESPIIHMLRLISSTAVPISPNQSYLRLALGSIEAACNGKVTRGSRLELLQQCGELSATSPSGSPCAPHLSAMVWSATAQAAANALQSFPIESARERDGSVSRDYENIIKILSFGLSFASSFQEWSHLLDSFVRVVRTEKGNQAVAITIVEPMAERLMHVSAAETYLPSTSLLGHSLSIPFLQGSGLGVDRDGTRSGDNHIFPHKLLESIAQTLQGAYEDFHSSTAHGLAEFIEGLTSFLGSGIAQFQCQVLESLQLSLGLWLKDESRKINLDCGVDSRILTACRALSSATLNILQTAVSHDFPSLVKFEHILCAGLESSHMSTTKRYVELWAMTFAPLAFVSPTAILQAVQISESRVQSATLPVQGGDQAMGMSARPISPDAVDHPAQAQDTQLSSPVRQIQDSMDFKASTRLNEPQLPDTFPQPTDAQIVDGVSASYKPRDHREIFSMIESIQSSSPASTPRKLGFDTPTQLRKIHGDPLAEIPLTPTLAPTENDEGFIGSSPTPGTRDPTPATKSKALTLNQPHGGLEIDPPSSPPEIHSRSPSPRKSLTKSARRRAAKAKKALASNQSTVNSPATSRLATENTDTPMTEAHDQDRKNSDVTPRAEGTTPSRGLRSALGEDRPTTEPTSALGDPDKTPVQQPTRKNKSISNSSSKKKRNQGHSKPGDDQPEQAIPTPPDNIPDSVMDSSEETESQIASQLGLDLELAVDRRGSADRAQPAEKSPMKKRKRDEDAPSSNRTDRRRSMRLSAFKDGDDVDSSQPIDSHSQSVNSQPVSPAKSLSPTMTRRSTRSSQRKEADDASADSLPATQGSAAPEPTQEAETPRPSKRPRKSLRLDDQSNPNSTVNTPQSVARGTRSRKTRSQQPVVEVQPAIPSTVSEDHSDSNHFPSQPDLDIGIVPESVNTEDRAEQNIPLVSTEEATPTPGSEMEKLVGEAIKPDLEMDLEVDAPQQSSDKVEQNTNVSTTGTQTQETPPEIDISEEGVTNSLEKILSEMKLASIGPKAFREIDDLLFKLRCEAQNASMRHNTSA